MRDELFGINWSGKEINVDFSDCFGVHSKADIKLDTLLTSVDLIIGNAINSLMIEPEVIDVLISKLSKIKDEINALHEIQKTVYEELDNIYSYIKQNKALVFFIFYSPDRSNFRLLVSDPTNMKCLMDRAINLRPNMIDIDVINNANDFYIKDMWARYISENILDNSGEISAATVYRYLLRNMAIDLETYKNIKRGTKRTELTTDLDVVKYHSYRELVLNKVYRFILFAISPDEAPEEAKNIKHDLIFHFYMEIHNGKKIPCVNIQFTNISSVSLFNREIKDFELLLSSITEPRTVKNTLSNILTRVICSLSCRITDIPNDPRTFNTPKEVIDIENKILDKSNNTFDIWHLVKDYIFKNMTYTKDYLEVYKLSKEDK